MSQEVHTIAILYPAPGKVDRLKELLANMCKDVHSKEEDATLRYIMTEQFDPEKPEVPDIVMVETYKDKEAAAAHAATSHFKELFANIEKEGLCAKAPYIARTVSKAGFDLDRKLI